MELLLMMRALHILVFCTISYASACIRIGQIHNTEEQKALYDAARDGDLSFINGAIARLSSSGLDLNWRNPDDLRYTALQIAAEEGHTSIVGALLDAGADPDVKDSDGWTPAYVAAKKNSTGALELLLAHGADPNIENTYGTPLTTASLRGHLEAARMLIQAGAHVNYVRPMDGITALHFAAMYNNPDVALLLLQNGADKNEKDDRGRTASDMDWYYGDDSVAVAQLIDNY